MPIVKSEELKVLETSELRFRRLFETARDGILLVAADTGIIIAANPFICELLSRTNESVVGTHLWDLGPLKDIVSSQVKFLELQIDQYVRYEDLPLETPSGRIVHVEFISNVYREGRGSIIQCNIRDVSERYEARQKETAYYRGLRTISACNAALIHSSNAEQMSYATCDALVHEGGYASACLYAVEPLEDSNASALKFVTSAGIPAASFPRHLSFDSDKEMREESLVCMLHEKRSPIVIKPPLTPWVNSTFGRLINQNNYASGIVLPIMDADCLFGALVIFSHSNEVFDTATMQLLAVMASDLSFGLSDLNVRRAHAENEERLTSSFDEAIAALAFTAELRDPYTAGHQKRVAALAQAIAGEMKLSSKTIATIVMAATVHDLGKVQVPAEILAFPGALNDAQYEIIRGHSAAGYEILKRIDFDAPIAEIVHQHHERLDGSGYPNGLVGDQILLEAQVIAVADTIEAMSSHRPYRAGLGIDAALKEVSDHIDTRYNRLAVGAALRLFQKQDFRFQEI
jgi:PAS domain S-box-containing protein/putative nucleotidyltransferase with HDIG domain